MAVIFPKSSDIILKVAGIVVGIGALIGVAAFTYYSYPTVIDTGYQPVQPVPYSHKLHAGQLGLDCYYCHSTVYKAAFAAVPATSTCMNCHTQVKKDSPRLEPIRQSFATGEPMHWVQIHRLPDFVYFNHSAHLSAEGSLREFAQKRPVQTGMIEVPHQKPAIGGAMCPRKEAIYESCAEYRQARQLWVASRIEGAGSGDPRAIHKNDR